MPSNLTHNLTLINISLINECREYILEYILIGKNTDSDMTSQAISVRRKVSQDVRINHRRFLGYESLINLYLFANYLPGEREGK